MGIQGLLPFLKKIHTQVNIAQFQGCTVAIDAYCWLHKGAFSCADKLALGEKTEQYVYYCMKYVDYLLRSGLKPILVFDGCHLPSKKNVETSRRERRELNRKKAAQLLREGKRAEARDCLQKCIDISPQMALELMKACRARGVDCIVAPYEADAQLAYLNKAGIAQIIITEDSDLLLFGCDKVIFKMDFFGNGVLIEQSRLNEVLEIQDSFYTFDKFRYMCILSGCDYLPSLHGVGLAKACKVFKLARQTDIRQLLKKLPTYLKMNVVVTNDYIEGFIRADNTFLYQLSFDPLTHKLCPLNPYPPEVEIEELRYAGPYFSHERALQIALGNVDIHTHERIADFDPETFVPKYAKKQEKEMLSIWKRGYRPRSKADKTSAAPTSEISSRPFLTGKEMEVKNNLPKRSPVKRVKEVEETTDVRTNTELVDLYSAPKSKRRRMNSDEDLVTSPKAKAKDVNPFDTDEESDDQKTSRRGKTAKKQVLSPSKSSNQIDDVKVKSTHEAFTIIEQEFKVDLNPEEKENGKKSVSPKRNKFAVSALAKRAKFSLDAPALPNIKIEVKSRYFGASSSSAAASTSSADESKTSINSTSTGDKTSAAERISLTPSPNERRKRTSGMNDASTTAAAGVCEDAQSVEDHPSASPELRHSGTSLLSKFSYGSASGKSSSTKSKDTKLTGSSSKSSQFKKSSNSSPGSAFNWSSFMFAKSSSSPNISSSVSVSAGSSRPFKRVMSDSKSTESPDSLQEFASITEQGDSSQNNQSGLTVDSNKNSVCTDSKPNDSQGGEGERLSDVSWSQQSSSTAGVDASQRSNLYSIDSDCFPTSQDFVDLTDCETDSQSVKNRGDGDFASPLSASQGSLTVTLKSPKSTPRTTSTTSTKKCRASGLSRGKKKTSTGDGDEKQQKIRDMFSRFAHQKGKKLEPVRQTNFEENEEDPSASEHGTPSNPLLAYSTETHRKLLL